MQLPWSGPSDDKNVSTSSRTCSSKSQPITVDLNLRVAGDSVQSTFFWGLQSAKHGLCWGVYLMQGRKLLRVRLDLVGV